eukprot:2702738-Alexandrium_andersonii.AAC.1
MVASRKNRENLLLHKITPAPCSLRTDLAIPGSAVLVAMPAEAAMNLPDREYRTMARTRLATQAFSRGLTCA